MRRCWLVLVVLLLGVTPWVGALASPSSATSRVPTSVPADGATVDATAFDLTDALRLGEDDGVSRLVRTLTAARAPRSPRPGSVLAKPRPPRSTRARRVVDGTADVIQSHRRQGERLLRQALAPPATR